MRLFIMIVATSFLFVAPRAQADCGLSVTASNLNLTWTSSFTSLSVEVTVTKANDEACDYGIGFTKGGAASYAGRRGVTAGKSLSYQLYQDNALTKILKDYPDLTSTDDVVQGGFGTGTNQTQTLHYYFAIPFHANTGQALYGAGTYTDSFALHVYLGSDPLTYTAPVATATVNLTVTVNPSIELSLVDSGSSFQTGALAKSLDFGILRDGQTKTFDMFVRTNAGFSVSFSSSNNGVLKTVVAGGHSTVPYKLSVNSSQLDLSSSASTPVVALTGSGQTSTSGLAYPILITIGPISGSASLAGSHVDAITVTASTTE